MHPKDGSEASATLESYYSNLPLL